MDFERVDSTRVAGALPAPVGLTAKKDQPGRGRSHPRAGQGRAVRGSANTARSGGTVTGERTRALTAWTDVQAAMDVSGRGRLGGGRNRCDGLQDLRRDLVGVALRVRAAVFQIALVAIVDEGVRHPDRGAAVRDTVGEGIDRSCLMLAG